MKYLISVVPAVVALYLVFQTGDAIKCYICNSHYQGDCADWFDNRTQHLVECGDNVTMCRKIVQEATYKVKGKEVKDLRYIRTCAVSGEVGGDEGRVCMERTGTYGIKMRYCQCDNQSGCNGASTMKLPVMLGLLPLLGLLFISKYL